MLFRSAPAVPFSQPCDELKPQDAVGFEVGWDHARHGLALPVATNPDPDANHSVLRQGWLAGRATFGHRTGRPARAVRHWLGLRLQAWSQGRAFEGVLVTPRLLAQLEVSHCPVTREPLTQGESQPGDAVVMVLNQGAGCAAGNLAMVSRRVAAARGSCSAEQAMAIAIITRCFCPPLS